MHRTIDSRRPLKDWHTAVSDTNSAAFRDREPPAFCSQAGQGRAHPEHPRPYRRGELAIRAGNSRLRESMLTAARPEVGSDFVHVSSGRRRLTAGSKYSGAFRHSLGQCSDRDLSEVPRAYLKATHSRPLSGPFRPDALQKQNKSRQQASGVESCYCRTPSYAKIPRTTVPWTSVSRKSRPSKRYVSLS